MYQFVLVHLFQRHVRHLQQDALSQLMNGPIRKKLKIIPEDCSWGGNLCDLIKASFVELGGEKGGNSKALIC